MCRTMFLSCIYDFMVGTLLFLLFRLQSSWFIEIYLGQGTESAIRLTVSLFVINVFLTIVVFKIG